MTSKSLFFKLMKEDLKRRIWSIALSSLVFVIILPIFCTIYLSSSEEKHLDEWEMEELIRMLGPSYEMLIIVTILCAVIIGISGFFYLHSRKKVDLYHSIPIRREMLFGISYLNGVLIYVIPYIVNLALCITVLQMNDIMNKEIFETAIAGLGIHLLFFCMIYTLTILAVMLTGNLIISVCGISVFLLYMPFVKMLKDQYFSSFFDSYYNIGSDSVSSFLSPVESYINIANEYLNGQKYIVSLVSAVLATLLLIGLSLLLYQRRPSEAAGNAMVFKVSKPLIKFLLVVPISLAGGLFLRSTVTHSKEVWYFFGIIFCFGITYSIIQIMYDFDIRSAFHHKRQMLFCAVTATMIACIFRFDLIGYDSYQPKKEDIQSMSVVITGLNQNLEHYIYLDDGAEYISDLDYELEKMELTDFDAAYEMAQLGIKSESSIQLGYEDRNDLSDRKQFNYFIKYSLKNGRESYRQYSLLLDASENLINEIYANEDYKEAHFPIFELPENEISQIYVTYGMELLNYEAVGIDSKENINYSLEGKSVKELLRIYKEELRGLRIDEIAKENPVAKMEFVNGDIIYRNYYVYPSFTNTLAFLEGHGFDTTKEINPENISEIIVAGNIPVLQSSDGTEGLSYKQLSYTEWDDINEILPALIDAEYYNDNRTVINVVDYMNVDVIYLLDEKGLTQSNSYHIRKDQLPAIIETDFALPNE